MCRCFRQIFCFTLLTVSYSLSPFNGHSPGEPGLAGVYWSKGWRRWCWQLDYWSYKSRKAPVRSSPPTNQHPVFLQAGCPSCRPTNSVKALKGKYHISWSCLPQAHLGVFQLCLWPLIAPGYLGGGLPCLSSALWCQYPSLLLKVLNMQLQQCTSNSGWL